MLEFLPDVIKSAIDLSGTEGLREIRIRAGKPIYVCKFGQASVLKYKNAEIKADLNMIDYIIKQVSDYSLFTVENSLKKGFITSRSGERIGICGECVYESNSIYSIKNITSLCIRVPCEIKGASDMLFSEDLRGKNILILSPPAKGKTTILRDLIKNLSQKYGQNILVCDERNELSATNCSASFDLGKTSDVILFSSKIYAMNIGVRALNPSVIAMDELTSDDEAKAVCETVYSGVNVICTAHADSLNGFKNRSFGKILCDNTIFDCIFTLSGENVGQLKEIFLNGKQIL